MLRVFRDRPITAALAAAVVLSLAGCTSLRDYVHNGFKVGPNYGTPAAPVAEHWIDAADKRVSQQPADLSRWWEVFKDPKLNWLIACADQQNLTLREAAFRILQARDQLAIARGDLFPQSQNATGSYTRRAASANPPNPAVLPKPWLPPGPGNLPRLPQVSYSNQWALGFNLAWELDFWGRFRRAVESQEDSLEASVADYDQVLVTLLADVAATYVQIRTDEERIRLLQENIDIQRKVVIYAEERLRAGTAKDSINAEQVRSILLQSQAAVEQLRIDQRQASNRLCVLLGMPPADLERQLGAGPIPTAPAGVVVGLPAELLSQRPDVRRAQWLAAAQAEQIGIAQAELYPIVTINGSLGWQAKELPYLFSSNAFNGSVGPSFQWNILQYGRLINNVRFQDAKFQELVVAYQQTVLTADQEVEDGLVAFLRNQERERLLHESAQASRNAVRVIGEQQRAGTIDFNQFAVIEQNLIQQQDQWAQARGDIALGLIAVYRALGGGWEIRSEPEGSLAVPAPEAPAAPPTPEEVQSPPPVPPGPARKNGAPANNPKRSAKTWVPRLSIPEPAVKTTSAEAPTKPPEPKPAVPSA